MTAHKLMRYMEQQFEFLQHRLTPKKSIRYRTLGALLTEYCDYLRMCEQEGYDLKNEFVLFEDKGIYMQIVRKGEGRKMESGERGVYMARYIEQNIETGDTISGSLYASSPDYFTCKRDGDSFTASFTQGYMMNTYSSSAVPNGWLVPFSYITPGRPNDKAAKVRLILPHSQSTSMASQYVYPTYYEITYIPEPNI